MNIWTKKVVILKFTAFKHRTSLFRIRKTENKKKKKKWCQAKCVRKDLIMSKMLNYVKNVKEVQFVYDDINCDFKFTLCDIDENILHQCKNWKKYWTI